jgi:tRNA(His) 5'-end guanylyltransferase
MKNYEGVEAKRRFMPLLPIYARIDGKSFSKFTKGMKRPYDADMSRAMVETTKYLVEQTNACMGYTQSDEISLVWYSDKIDSQVFFDGRIQKMTSIVAAMTSVKFLTMMQELFPQKVVNTLPVFDCRVFQLPTKTEATNVFVWRERDATKNAISMAAQSVCSHKSLQNKNGNEMQEMMWQRGINFNDYPAFFKRGTFVQRRKVMKQLTAEELDRIPEKHRPTEPVLRTVVQTLDMPPFTKVTNREAVIFDGADPIVAVE